MFSMLVVTLVLDVADVEHNAGDDAQEASEE
jgi:hypothetical protein